MLPRETVIDVVNGYGLGGDYEIALACDIRIGSNNAKITKQKLQLAFHQDGAELRLIRIVGPTRAKNSSIVVK